MCAINLVYQADSSYNSLTFFFSVLSLFDCCFRFLRSLLLFASPLLLKERSIFYFLCFLFRVVFVVWLMFVYFVVVVGLLLLLLGYAYIHACLVVLFFFWFGLCSSFFWSGF